MEASDTGRARWVALGALSVKSIARDRQARGGHALHSMGREDATDGRSRQGNKHYGEQRDTYSKGYMRRKSCVFVDAQAARSIYYPVLLEAGMC
jgi:hypothetical protein